MLHQPTIEKLIAMRLQGMVSALEEMEQQEATVDPGFEEKLALMVDRQYTWRQNLAFRQRLRRARLRGNACVEDPGPLSSHDRSASLRSKDSRKPLTKSINSSDNRSSQRRFAPIAINHPEIADRFHLRSVIVFVKIRT